MPLARIWPGKVTTFVLWLSFHKDSIHWGYQLLHDVTVFVETLNVFFDLVYTLLGYCVGCVMFCKLFSSGNVNGALILFTRFRPIPCKSRKVVKHTLT